VRRRCFLPAFVAALSFWAAPARADVASWLFVGGGPSVLDRPSADRTVAGSLQLDTGLGTSPSRLLAVGGLLRMHTRFGDGSDFGLLVRTATRGYSLGDFGAAIDLGGYLRTWGDQKPGLGGTLSLGAPWGITLNLDAGLGPNDVRTYAAVLGLDLARFTIYRSTGTGWWSNPFPSPRTEHD